MELKAQNPVALLHDRKSHPFLEGFFEISHLKQLYRQGWLVRGIPRERCESVAEHSFGVAVLALWLSQVYFPRLDPLKVVEMALLHDLGEIYAGDVIPSDPVSREAKRELEGRSIKQVLGKIPGGQGWLELWDEFERGESPEASFVHQIDRLEMGLQAKVYAAQGFLGLEEFSDSAGQGILDTQLSEILEGNS